MRKNELLPLLIILSFLFGLISCKKNNTEIQDDIIFKDISKLVIFQFCNADKEIFFFKLIFVFCINLFFKNAFV